MTVVWRCPECYMPVKFHLDVEADQAGDAWQVSMDIGRHVEMHLRSHE